LAQEGLVGTKDGNLGGARDGAVWAWLGVPYARPPLGERRFCPPEPFEPWKGIRPAIGFGAASLQKPLGPWGGTQRFLGPALSEDCLTLNIWSPKADDRRRPVLFWIHGGGFTSGSAKIFRGAQLAKAGDMIVVTINYRLGVFGFVNFGAALEDPNIASNLGLLDQIEALKWVRENIAGFGGDPDKITIAGESAGSVAVSLLLISEAAKPLFRGAIMQSGSLSLIHSHEKSLRIASAYLDCLGLRGGSLADLQKLAPQQLFGAQQDVARRFPDTSPAAPWFDGTLFPPNLQSCQLAKTAPVPLLAGTNHDEISLFALPGPSILPSRRRVLESLARSQLGEAAAASILTAYPLTWAGERQLGTDLCFTMPQIHFAERHAGPVFLYRFDYKMAFLGAAHALELLFLWDQRSLLALLIRGGALTGARLALAKRMREAWVSFVRMGQPGPDWPIYEESRRSTRIFDLQDKQIDDPEGERRVLWAGRDIAVGA
jgi:para-nitrobenzyl esterase